MGLLEKAALVIVVSISSQIVCSSCMPRNHCIIPITSNIKNTKSQDDKTTKYGVPRNSSEGIPFPCVEYPLGEYYRFLNDYPVQCKPNEYMSNSSCQVQTNKIATKYKRKLDKVNKTKVESPITTSIMKNDPHPQPYCFRTTNFFPEVEYPLSARDMWISNYWSRLQDVKRNRIEEVDRQVNPIPTKNKVVSNNDPDYETLSLNTLIKTLNIKKPQVTEMANKDNAQPPNETNEPGDIHDVIISITPSEMNIDSYTGPSVLNNCSHGDIATTNTSTNNNVFDSKVFNPRKEKDYYENIISHPINANNSPINNFTKESVSDIAITTTNMDNTNNYPHLSIPEEDNGPGAASTTTSANRDTHSRMPATLDPNEISGDLLSKTTNTAVTLPNETISIVTSEIENPIPSTILPQNLSRYLIATESIPSTNIYTPLDDYDCISSMVPDIVYSDVTDATTAVPFKCITSPMSCSGTLINENVFGQRCTPSPNPILTTNSPSSLIGAPTVSNSYDDYPIIASESQQNVLDIDLGNFTTSELLPEDSDDTVIYFDTEMIFSCQENFSEYAMAGDEDMLFTYFDTLSCCLTSTLSTTGQRNKSHVLDREDFPILSTETGSVDLNKSLNSSCLNENNGTLCASSASPSTQIQNGPSGEMSTDTSFIAADDIWLLVENEYEPVYSMIESNTDEELLKATDSMDQILYFDTDEELLKGTDTMDQTLYFEDSNSTLQYEYIDGTSSSFTEIPYDLIL